MEYRIGFFNDKLETGEVLEQTCNRVYSDIESLYRHLRTGDIIVFNSFYSIYGLDFQELRGKIEDFKLKVEYTHTKHQEGTHHKPANIFTLNMNMAVIDFITEQKEEVKRILDLI